MAKQSLKKPENYDGSAVESYLREIFAKADKTYSQNHLADAMKVDSRHVAGRYVRGDYKDRHWTAKHIENILHYLGLAQDGEEKERLYALITAKPAHNALEKSQNDALVNISLEGAHVGGNVTIGKIDMGAQGDNEVSSQNCYLPTFERQYYYELQLAEPVPIKHADDKKDKYIPHEIRHLSENINSKTNSWHKPEPASQRFRAIANNQSDAVHVILGEPGGGKTTLLSKWAHDAYAAYQQDGAQPFPIYMRLRELGNPDDKNAALAAYYKRLTSDTINIQPFLAKEAKALWLFDGWDELVEGARQSWVSYINSLAGQKIVSCRVLRYQDDFGATARRYLIYGLNRAQQKEYLQKIVPQLQEVSQPHHNADDAWVDELLRRLHSQEYSRLRQLAISPLLLQLIAETNPPDNIKLPNTRPQFYDDAISAMLKREQRLGNIRRLGERNLKKALAEIAHHAGLNFNFSAHILTDGLEAICGEDEAKAQKLEENLINCGILRPVGNSYEFLHATFHEWALAHYLAQQENPLVSAVKLYWHDINYDEIIALLWTHESVNSQQREEATLFLMEVGCKKRGRSGLKQSIFFWKLSGIPIADRISKAIWKQFSHRVELRLALAQNINLQNDSFLTELLKEDISYIGKELAINPYLSDNLMLKLSKHPDVNIRKRLAMNPKLSDEVMCSLARDTENHVRWTLAMNPWISISVRKILEKNRDLNQKWKLPSRDSSTQENLKQLEENENYHQYLSKAIDPLIRIQEMFEIIQNDDVNVRMLLAGNVELYPEVALALAKDENEYVRAALALNTYLCPNAIRILARDKVRLVRKNLTLNLNLPIDVMQLLANPQNNDLEIRSYLSMNPNVCWEVFLD